MRRRYSQPYKREAGSILEPHFTDEDKAREYLEGMRWPEGAVCPHCGAMDHIYKVTPKRTERYQDASGKWRIPRKGLWKCGGCKKQFSVTVKTIFEDSHIPIHKWLLAIHLICSSKKGMSAHQLYRNLGFGSYKSAWFMAHRIRYMLTGELPEKMEGIIECDETFVGGKAKNKHKSLRNMAYAIKPGLRTQDRPAPHAGKEIVFSLVQRGGRVHSRHIEKVTAENLKRVINEVVHADAHLMTDTGMLRKKDGEGYRAKHSLVNHTADEYVRWEEGVCVTTNSVEGFFSLLKRGVMGTFHHVGRKHLHRYLAEFDFRWNNRETTDGERAEKALKGFEGKRLTYKAAGSQN
jgi:transposase-like protein